MSLAFAPPRLQCGVMAAPDWLVIPEQVPEIDYLGTRAQLSLPGRGPRTGNPHTHPHFELIMQLHGRRQVCLFDRSREIFCGHPGDLVVFRPGEGHLEHSPDEEDQTLVLRFDEHDLQRNGLVFPSFDRIGPVLPLCGQQRRFQELFARMADEHAQSDRLSSRMMDALLTVFVLQLDRAVDEHLRTHDWLQPGEAVQRLAERLRAQPERELDDELAALSQRCGLDAEQLKERFRARFGIGAQRYHVQCRLARAAELLRHSQRPAQEIAAEVGYTDAYYFYRLFKRHVGVTTGEYRGSPRRLPPPIKQRG